MFGNCGCEPPWRGRGRFLEGALRHLPWFGGPRSWLEGIELSDEQIDKIADLKHESFARMAHGRVDKMELMGAIFKELGKPTINRERVAELKGKVKEHKAAMTDLMIDNMLAFAEILTPEQRKKIRIKKIRQFLGSDDEEPECPPEPPHPPHGHHPHDHGRHHGHD
jgi:Spy/CpxP family protein refolding chaperone